MDSTYLEERVELTVENVQERTSDTALPTEERVWQACSLVAFILHDIPEAGLRACLSVAGVDVSDPDQFDIAQDYVTMFVKHGALDVSDLDENSLVADTSDGYIRSIVDDGMRLHMEKMIVDHTFFMQVLPSVFD